MYVSEPIGFKACRYQIIRQCSAGIHRLDIVCDILVIIKRQRAAVLQVVEDSFSAFYINCFCEAVFVAVSMVFSVHDDGCFQRNIDSAVFDINTSVELIEALQVRNNAVRVSSVEYLLVQVGKSGFYNAFQRFDLMIMGKLVAAELCDIFC